MKKLLGIIDQKNRADVPIYIEERDGIEVVTFKADLDIDCDGSGGNPFHDPYFQPDTRYHFNGKALNAEKVPYAVVPPMILKKTRGKVLGSLCIMVNTKNGKVSRTVVGDSGPTFKIGEASPAAAEELGLDPNPNHGGTSDDIIEYTIFVGQPARVCGVEYPLQSA